MISTRFFALVFTASAAVVQAQATDFTTFPDVLKLSEAFDPVVNGTSQHRSTPFTLSADGTNGWIAFVSADGYDSVLVQKFNTADFQAVGEPTVIQSATGVSSIALKKGDPNSLVVAVDGGDSTKVKRSLDNILQLRQEPHSTNCNTTTTGCIDPQGVVWVAGKRIAASSSSPSLTHFPNTTTYLVAHEYGSPSNIAVSLVDTQTSETASTNITQENSTQHRNVHAAAFDSDYALLTWETVSGTGIANTQLQVIKRTGELVGAATTAGNIYVTSNIVPIGTKLCWSYTKAPGLTKAMSFACVELSTAAAGASTSCTQLAEATSTVGQTSTADIPSRSFEPVNPTEFPIITPTTAVAGTTSTAAETQLADTTCIAHTAPTGPSGTAVFPTSTAALPTRTFEPADPTDFPITTATSASIITRRKTGRKNRTRTASSTAAQQQPVEPTTTAASSGQTSIADIPSRSFEPVNPTEFPIITASTTAAGATTTSTSSRTRARTAAAVTSTQRPAESTTTCSDAVVTPTETAAVPTRTFDSKIGPTTTTATTTAKFQSSTAADITPTPTASASAAARTTEPLNGSTITVEPSRSFEFVSATAT